MTLIAPTKQSDFYSKKWLKPFISEHLTKEKNIKGYEASPFCLWA